MNISIPDTSSEPEFYAIERVLIAGPRKDILPFADRARQAGHAPTLLLNLDDSDGVKTSHPILTIDDEIVEDDFDLAIDLHCTDLQAKAETLCHFEDTLADSVPVFSLTNAISVSELARELLMPERLLGISLLPPFAESSLAELMSLPTTQKAVIRTAEQFFESLSMKTVAVADSPGGVLVRTVVCMINEAAFALQDRISSAGDIDKAMLFGLDFPSGLLQWGDKIGLDKVLFSLDGIYAEFKEERYRSAPLLKKLVRANTGFYSLTS